MIQLRLFDEKPANTRWITGRPPERSRIYRYVMMIRSADDPPRSPRLGLLALPNGLFASVNTFANKSVNTNRILLTDLATRLPPHGRTP